MIKLISDLKTENLIKSLKEFSWEAALIMIHYSQEIKNMNRAKTFLIKIDDYYYIYLISGHSCIDNADLFIIILYSAINLTVISNFFFFST